MVIYENGVQQFNDFGKEIEIKKIYDQIKLVFDPEGKIVAVRPKQKESLVAKSDSIWNKVQASKPEPMSEELKYYYEQEALEYYRWIKRERMYCSQKYGKKKKKGATC